MTWRDKKPNPAINEAAAARSKLKDLEASAACGEWAYNLLAALVGDAWRPPSVLAEKLRWEEARLRGILESLKGLGLVEDRGAGVRLSGLGRAVLDTWE